MTRLETRTKESTVSASMRVRETPLVCAVKAKAVLLELLWWEQ